MRKINPYILAVMSMLVGVALSFAYMGFLNYLAVRKITEIQTQHNSGQDSSQPVKSERGSNFKGWNR